MILILRITEVWNCIYDRLLFNLYIYSLSLSISSLECWLGVVDDKDCWLESILISALSLTYYSNRRITRIIREQAIMLSCEGGNGCCCSLFYLFIFSFFFCLSKILPYSTVGGKKLLHNHFLMLTFDFWEKRKENKRR